MTDVDGSPTLSVGFEIDSERAVETLRQIDRAMESTTTGVVGDANRIEEATRQMVKADQAVAGFRLVGSSADRAMESVRTATNRAEKSGEALVRRLEQQANAYGKTREELRRLNAEQLAERNAGFGNTDLAERLRAATQRMEELERGSKGVTAATGQQRASMQSLGFQLQDFSVQVVGGTSVLRAFAMQAPQAAGALNGFGGALGKVGGFLAGPWGIALTLATTLGAGLAESLLKSADAANTDSAAKTRLKEVMDRLSGAQEKLNRTTQAGMIAEYNAAEATRQLTIRKHGLLDVLLREQQAKLASARATEATPGGTVPGAGMLGRSADRYAWEIAETNKAIAANDKAMQAAQTNILVARGALIRREVAGATDAATAATQRHEDAVSRLTVQYEAGKLSSRDYQAQLIAEDRTYQAAQKSIADATKADRAAGAAARREHAKELREIAAAARELQSTYETLEGRFDTVASAGRGYSKDLADIAKLQRAGKIDQETADAWGFKAARDAAAKVAEKVDEIKLAVDDVPALTQVKFEVTGLDKLLGTTLNPFDVIARDARDAAGSLSGAFDGVGRSIGRAVDVLGDYGAQQDRLDRMGLTREQLMSESAKLRLNSTIAATNAAKGLFAENSRGYAAMEAAERALMAVQLVKTGIDVAGGAARMFASLGPAAFPAVAAMLGVMAGLGFSGRGGGASAPTNTGTGTVFGNSTAQSESIKRSLDSLREVNVTTSVYAREQLAALRSIDSQIGGVAVQIVRGGDLDATKGINTGFSTNAIGSVLKAVVPIFGGALASLFGSKTSITGSGLYAGAQSLGSILGSGFDASTYADTEKVKKFLGITVGRSTSTKYGAIDPALESQFTMILRGFNDAIASAAGPLGQSTDDIQRRLNGFVVNLGKIDLTGLDGEQIQAKLENVFGAAADRMAEAAFPGLSRFQQVGEGAYQTLVRVASTVEAVTGSLNQLGLGARNLSLDAKVALADQFDSVGDLVNAADAFFAAYYTPAEQNAAKLSQLNSVFLSLGVSTPASIAAFRQLVEAQDLATAAGRATYATLLQLAPAFADLQKTMASAKSAADVLAEREDLERKLLELAGDTAAIRALDLAKLDASNRGLQQQVWAVEDAQAAVKAAEDLREAWGNVGKSILDEVDRIRGVTTDATSGGFAAAMGRFNDATLAARAGDQDAAKSLPALSQALLKIAGETASSRQELDRVSAATASSLSDTAALIGALSGAGTSPAALLAAAGAQAAAAAPTSNDGQVNAIDEIRQELADMRREIVAVLTTTASNTGRLTRYMEDITAQNGGDAISVVQAA